MHVLWRCGRSSGCVHRTAGCWAASGNRVRSHSRIRSNGREMARRELISGTDLYRPLKTGDRLVMVVGRPIHNAKIVVRLLQITAVSEHVERFLVSSGFGQRKSQIVGQLWIGRRGPQGLLKLLDRVVIPAHRIVGSTEVIRQGLVNRLERERRLKFGGGLGVFAS